MNRPDVPGKQAAHWLRLAACAENGQALQAIGCAYADLLAAQCEADMHDAVRKAAERHNPYPSPRDARDQ